jgi:hypothetical protein
LKAAIQRQLMWQFHRRCRQIWQTMPTNRRLERVSRLSLALEQRGYPRLTMLVIVSGAAATAFLTSASLLWAGVRYMPVRYAVASLLGYAVFVWLVRGWLSARDRREAGQRLVENAADATDVVNIVDLPGAVLRTAGRGTREVPIDVFQGGRSGGAGATAAFGNAPPQMPVMVMAPGSTESSTAPSWASGLDDDALKLLPLLAAAAVFIGLFAAGSVVWAAPQLLAEILVDGAIAGQAYRRLRTGSWSGGVIRRTWKPMLAIFVAFVALGFAGHYFDPAADSIGDLFR